MRYISDLDANVVFSKSDVNTWLINCDFFCFLKVAQILIIYILLSFLMLPLLCNVKIVSFEFGVYLSTLKYCELACNCKNNFYKHSAEKSLESFQLLKKTLYENCR